MMLMDGDDWVDEQWIENLMSGVRDDTDLVVGRFALSYNDKEVPIQTSLPSGFYAGDDFVLLKNKMIFDTERYTYGVISPSVWNKLFIRNKLVKLYRNIPNELTLGEDMAITMPYVKDAESISVVDAPIFYRYVQRSDSMVRSYDNRLVNNISALKKYLDSILWSNCEKEQLNYYYSKLVIYSVKNQLRGTGKIKDELEHIYSIPGLENILNSICYNSIPLKQRIILLAFRKRMYSFLKIISRLYN